MTKKERIFESAEFDQLIEAVSDDLVMAGIHFQLYRDLLAAATLEFRRETSQAWTFWSLTISAHYNAGLLRLTRAYDHNSRSASLPNLLNWIESHPTLFSADEFRSRMSDNPFVESLASSPRVASSARIAEQKKSVGDQDPVVNKLTVTRNLRVAHTAVNHVLDSTSLAERFPLSDDDVHQLIQKGQQLINEYSSLFRASTAAARIVGYDDYLSVLRSVRSELEIREARIHQEMRDLGVADDSRPAI